MSDGAQVDYDALAKQYGATSSAPAQIDYDELAKQHGATSSESPQTWNARADTGQPLVTPLPGESFADTMKRAVAAGKTVTPGQIQAGTRQAIKQIPAVISSAGLSGPAVLGAGALLPDLAASAVPSQIAGSTLLGTAAQGAAAGATGAAATDILTQPLQGQNPFSVAGLKQAGKSALLGGATGASVSAAAYGIGKGLQAVGWLPSQSAARAPVAGSIQPSLNVSSRDVQEYANEKGIRLTPWQATQEPAAGQLQAVGERSVIGSKPLSEAVQENAAKFLKGINDFADDLDPRGLGATTDSAGNTIKQAVQVAKDVAHENASFAYKDLPTVEIDQTPIGKAWLKVRGELPMGAEEKILAQVPRNMRGQVADILSGNPELPPINSAQAIKLRSLFLDLGRTMEDELPSRAQGLFKQMASATDGAIESGMGAERVADKWRAANAGWREYVQDFGDRQSPLNQILKQQDPAKITDQLLQRSSVRDLQFLREHNAEGALEALKRQVIEDVANSHFGIGREGLGGYPDSFLRELFGSDGVRELYTASEVGRRFRWQMNPSGTSNVMLAAEQYRKPSAFALYPLAAKASMPRPAASYLQTLASPASRYALSGATGSLLSLRDLLGNSQ